MLLTNIKLFEKTKSGLELVFLPHFLHNFLIKVFLLRCSINWPNFILWLPLIREILNNKCAVNLCWPDCDVINFQIDLIFLSKLFSTCRKMQDKNSEQKELLRWNKMPFSSFLKGYHWSKEKKFFLEGKSPTLNLTKVLMSDFKPYYSCQPRALFNGSLLHFVCWTDLNEKLGL